MRMREIWIIMLGLKQAVVKNAFTCIIKCNIWSKFSEAPFYPFTKYERMASAQSAFSIFESDFPSLSDHVRPSRTQNEK